MYFVNTATAGFAMRFFKVKYTMSAVIAKSRVRCTYSARTAFLTLKLISAYRTRVVTERAYKCAVITCTARLTYVFPRFTFTVQALVTFGTNRTAVFKAFGAYSAIANLRTAFAAELTM